MNSSSSAIMQDDSPFDYLEIRDFQRRISELQKANLNLKMSLIEQENRMSKIMADGGVSLIVINEFIQNTKIVNDLNSQIRDLNFELDEAKTTIMELRSAEKSQKEDKKQLQNEINILKTQNQIYASGDQSFDSSNASKTTISLKLEISKLKQDIASQDARNAELTVEILNLQSKLNDYENDEIRYDSEVSRVKRQLSEVQNDLTRAKEENIQLKTEIETLNQQLTEKNDKIKEKSRKNRTFKQIIQNNLNEIQIYTTKFQRRANLLQSQMGDFMISFQKRIEKTNLRCETIHKSIANMTKNALNNSKKKYQSTILRQSSIIHDLAALSAKIVGISISNIPEINDLINDESVLELFIGRVNAAHEMQKAEIRSSMNNLEEKSRINKDQKKNELSSKVSNFVNNLQSTINSLTKTLHQDHLQLIDALTTSEYDMSE